MFNFYSRIKIPRVKEKLKEWRREATTKTGSELSDPA
jgi:hypothetical protein